MLTNYVQVSFVFWRRLSDGVEWNGALSGPVESRPQPASAVDQSQTLLQIITFASAYILYYGCLPELNKKILIRTLSPEKY